MNLAGRLEPRALLVRSRLRIVVGAVIAACVATAARGQVPAAPVAIGRIIADTIPPFERPNGALLRTGELTYALTLTRSTGDPAPLGTRVVSVSEVSVGGTPSWLIADRRTGTILETTDSVSLVRADLTPEHWSATIGKSRFAASFTRDSMFGGTETYQGRASFGIAVPFNALLSAGMAERIIEMLPLREGYRASAALVLVDGQSPLVVRSEIVVDGTETLTVGRQAIECWRVLLRTAAAEERLWVAREGTRVVRIEQAVGDGLLKSELQP